MSPTLEAAQIEVYQFLKKEWLTVLEEHGMKSRS